MIDLKPYNIKIIIYNNDHCNVLYSVAGHVLCGKHYTLTPIIIILVATSKIVFDILSLYK